MKNKPLQTDLIFDLVNAFRSIKSTQESTLFLQDILTANEIKNLSIRLRIAKLLLAGKKQREISMNLKVSIATVTKVNTWLNQKGDGFKKIISRLPTKYNIPTKHIRGPLEFHLPEVLALTIQYGIAAHQNKKTEELIKTAEEKRKVDKSLKKISDEYYKNKPKN